MDVVVAIVLPEDGDKVFLRVKAESPADPEQARHFPVVHAGGRGMIGGMNDSISQLTARVQAFVDARDWRRFHNPKDLSVAICAEAGELMQHFVWQQPDQVDARARGHRDEIASEIADVAILLFELADNLGLDLGEVIQQKIDRNEIRYPVEKARGNNRKYNEFDI